MSVSLHLQSPQHLGKFPSSVTSAGRDGETGSSGGCVGSKPKSPGADRPLLMLGAPNLLEMPRYCPQLSPSCPHPCPRPVPVPHPILPVIAARLVSRCDRSLPGKKSFFIERPRNTCTGSRRLESSPCHQHFCGDFERINGWERQRGRIEQRGRAGKRLPFGSRQQREADKERTNAFP